MQTSASITNADRQHLGPMSSEYLSGMRAKALRAAEVHTAGFRPYMAELCAKRAEACAALLAERAEAA